MGSAYSQDLRDRVLGAYGRGMRTRQIAEVFAVSPAWARRVKQVWREEGRRTALASGGSEPRKIDRDRLRELVEAQPDATLEQLRERLGIDCSLSGVHAALRAMGYRFKKSH